MARKSKPNEITLTRLYEAPVKMVWDAWTDPKQVAQWWGPRGFTITTHSKDFRPGGHWSYTMHGPDGKNYENKTIYLEIEKYSRMVYDHGGNDEQDRPPLFRVTVTFEETKGKTLMEMTMAFPSAEIATESKKFIKMAGGNSTWDRLGEYLEKNSTGRDVFVINQSFQCSQETMFELWTNPNHLSKWLAPIGFHMEFSQADLRPGMTSLYKMTNGTDTTMYGKIIYLEMNKPHRLLYEQQFCDEYGNVSRHPNMPTWPETMRTEVLLTAEDDGSTRVTVRWEPVGTVTSAEQEQFRQFRGSMTQGWTGSFDKLDDVLILLK